MIITKAPLRMSFLGGGSDFANHFNQHGGAVLGTAIDKYVYVTITEFKEKFHGYKYKLVYRKTELVNEIDEIEHPAIREAIRMICPDKSLELHIIADLPARTGLGSSSAFAIALIQALHAFNHNLISTERLAYEAIELERIILKEAGGYQDQIFSAYGGFNLLEFSDPGRFRVKRLPISEKRFKEIESHCLLLYTGILRNSFDVLEQQVKRNGSNTLLLCELANLAQEGAEYLCSNKKIEKFGHLLHRGWEIKQQLADLSLPFVDELYKQALTQGASGGKMLGAGKGGFLLLWAPPAVQKKIVKVIPKEMTSLSVGINSDASTIIHCI